MEARMMEMEGQLRVLQAAVESLVPTVADRVLCELTLRRAMLVVKSTQEDMEKMVMDALLTADEPFAKKKKKETTPAPMPVAQQARVQDATHVVESEDVTKEQPSAQRSVAVVGDAEAMVMSELDDAVSTMSDSDDDEYNDNDNRHVAHGTNIDPTTPTMPIAKNQDGEDQRMEVETSQESSASGHSSDASFVQEESDHDPLALASFDKVVNPRVPPIAAAPSAPVTLPTRPPVITIQRPTAHPSHPPAMAPSTLPPPPQQFLAVRPTISSTSTSYEEPPLANAPGDFEVQTKDSLAVAWEKWCCGEADRGFPPFRSINTRQIANKSTMRRLSDLRCTMMPIETLAKEQHLWKLQPTIAEAAAMFAALQDQLTMYEPPANGRNRKKEIAWSTALNLFRRGRKRKHEGEEDSGPVITEIVL